MVDPGSAPAAQQPEISISQLVKKHKESRDQERAATDKKIKEVMGLVPGVSAALVENVNKDVLDVFTNQHLLEVEGKELQSQSEKFLKQSQTWMNIFENFNQSLKELGDMSNWATVIEADARETVIALDQMMKSQKDLKTL
eukprot:TRINITY_DN440_c1_g2_i1.p1 TRINITY_DN440_c1_g2~~TRINITY_DN440_c1_g2_i1.p1  ORF type:complete len:141 (+),score=38.45 TRINITY_DN440_c1_g2_i1:69-491(+)